MYGFCETRMSARVEFVPTASQLFETLANVPERSGGKRTRLVSLVTCIAFDPCKNESFIDKFMHWKVHTPLDALIHTFSERYRVRAEKRTREPCFLEKVVVAAVDASVLAVGMVLITPRPMHMDMLLPQCPIDAFQDQYICVRGLLPMHPAELVDYRRVHLVAQ